MVNNSSSINTVSNHLPPSVTEHKKTKKYDLRNPGLVGFVGIICRPVVLCVFIGLMFLRDCNIKTNSSCCLSTKTSTCHHDIAEKLPTWRVTTITYILRYIYSIWQTLKKIRVSFFFVQSKMRLYLKLTFQIVGITTLLITHSWSRFN